VHILVVCIGNVCRSPLAELLLQQRLDELGGGFEVSSAGVSARDDRAMEPHAAAEAVRLGVDPAGFRSRRFSASVLEGVDLVLAATRDVRTQALQLAPTRMRSTFTLGEAAAVCAAPATTEAALPLEAGLVAHLARHRAVGSTAPDVDDPMGRDDEVHRRVADQIDDLVSVLAPAFARLVPRGGSPTT
jgi:protein-tyrosine phosphatase